MDELRTRIVAAVDRLQDELVALTRALVNCKTDSQSEDNPLFASEAVRCQDIVAGRLDTIGMEVSLEK